MSDDERAAKTPPSGEVGSTSRSAKAPSAALFGPLARHPKAPELALACHELARRYANEVVAPFALCPHVHNVETSLGAVGIVFEIEPTVEVGVAAIRALGANVVHLLYPLQSAGASPFERFGNRLAEALRRSMREPLVHACFHPAMVGGRENAYRLVGLLRRAPDPFVQFIPHGMQPGGTVLAGTEPTESRAESNFARLVPDRIDALVALTEQLTAARAELAPLAREIASGS